MTPTSTHDKGQRISVSGQCCHRVCQHTRESFFVCRIFSLFFSCVVYVFKCKRKGGKCWAFLAELFVFSPASVKGWLKTNIERLLMSESYQIKKEISETNLEISMKVYEQPDVLHAVLVSVRTSTLIASVSSRRTRKELLKWHSKYTVTFFPSKL